MEDKKNIVIKVKYPVSGKKTEHDHSSPRLVTEWNIKRILLALFGVVLIIVLLLYFIERDTQKADIQPKAASQPTATSSEKIVTMPLNPKIEINKNIIRALLTFKIINNEPAGEITLPLKLSKKNSTSVYYFVELAAMKGQTVYHEWLLDDELITRKKVNISDDNWRSSSRQLFLYSNRTHWTVRLVNETGQLLNEIHFNVIYE